MAQLERSAQERTQLAGARRACQLRSGRGVCLTRAVPFRGRIALRVDLVATLPERTTHRIMARCAPLQRRAAAQP